MDQNILGRTGLKVGVMGLGCGGASRLGARKGKTEAESVALIRQGLDAGVNFIDTAEAYGTEALVGKAIHGIARTSLVLSSKVESVGIDPPAVERSLEKSLRALGTDYIDILNLHGVVLRDYDDLLAEIVPTLLKVREQGKIRFIGLTESGKEDPQHRMLQRALQDDVWDALMVGFNLLNQSARDRVLPKAAEKNIGIVNMYAVRTALSRPEYLREVIAGLIASREIDPAALDREDPLGFLVQEGAAKDIIDAAYRFCRDEPGIHVVLSGTGSREHLTENIASFNRPPLPAEEVATLKRIFRNVDSVLGN